MKAKGKDKGRTITCQWWHRGGVEVIGLLMLNLVARWEWVVKAVSQLLYSWERAFLPIVEEVGGPQDWPGWIWRRENYSSNPGSSSL